MSGEPFIEVDHGPGGAAARFERPEEIVAAHRLADAPAALAALDAALARGRWIAGYASYELGYAFEPRLAALAPAAVRAPLLEFGVFEGTAPPVAAGPGGLLGPFKPAQSRAEYGAAFARIAEYIKAGHIYQANLTMALRGRWAGDASALAAALAAGRPVGRGALVSLPGATILSRSPELFFRLDGRGGIETAPMKGTAPRDPEPLRDAALRAGLAVDPKNRAENLMIVDLLRNDVGRIAEIGSVRTPQLYGVETYATVHQMVSRVTGRLRAGLSLSEILRALFPCGSVTGAPKIRAMEIIHEVEPEPRGAYCGAIGWAAPDGRAEFSVAIRGVTLYPDGEAVLNVGGGVVADFDRRRGIRGGAVEGAFRRPLPDGFRLIETFGWRPDAGFARLDAHLARLRATAARFGAPVSREEIDRALAGVGGPTPMRVRLTLRLDGAAEVSAMELAPVPEVCRLGLAASRLDPDDAWLRVKTTERAVYDAARAALPAGLDELLFLNTRGEVCEGTISNVFLQVNGGALLTPPLNCGLLPGVLRGEMLRQGMAREAVLRLEDLRRGELLVGNSLRGLRPAVLIGPAPRP